MNLWGEKMSNKKKKRKKKAAKKKNVSKKKNNRKKINSTKKTNTESSKKISSKNNIKSKTTGKKNTNKKVTSSNINTNKKIHVEKEQKTKQKVNKKKKFKLKIIVAVPIILVLILSALIILKNFNNNSDNNSIDFEKINFDEYLELYNIDEINYVYLYHESCLNCDDYEINLDKLQKEYGIHIKKFDYSNLSDSDINILKSSNSFLEKKIDIPTIISINGKEEISSISGIKEYSALKNFVSYSTNTLNGKTFIKIDVDEYTTLLNSDDKKLIYMCDSNQEYCESFTSILEKTTTDKKIKVYYLNMANVTSSDDWDKLESSSKIFDKQWFIPALLVVKNGKVIDYKMENLNEEDLNDFLNKNKL